MVLPIEDVNSMKDLDYPQIHQLIDKDWLAPETIGDRLVINPANGIEIGRIPRLDFVHYAAKQSACVMRLRRPCSVSTVMPCHAGTA